MSTHLRWAGRFAGSFYPDEPSLLEHELSAWMDPEPRCATDVFGILVPHAGYVYSGRTAARAVARARSEDVRTVVLLAPSHRIAVEGVARLQLDGFDTPLGGVEIDSEWGAQLDGCGVHTCGPFAEHSLEVQLPLVQLAWPGARVVPLVFGRADRTVLRELGAFLAASWTPATRVLATTDLSHYHAREQAKILDDVFERELLGGDPDSLVRALAEHRAEACGAGPVVAWMEMARARRARIEVVERSDSGDAFGEIDRVVGYLSALARAEESA